MQELVTCYICVIMRVKLLLFLWNSEELKIATLNLHVGMHSTRSKCIYKNKMCMVWENWELFGNKFPLNYFNLPWIFLLMDKKLFWLEKGFK